ncbi:MAG: hypothetical protein ACI8P3_001260 [Saprospiraceae bacterium]|jgi:hypothetical protein
MKNMYFLLSFLLIVGMSIQNISCTSDKLPEPMAGEECDEFDATYEGDVKAIIDASCALAGCHVTGGGAPGNFMTYAGLADYANTAPNGLRDRVIAQVNDPVNGMPPDGDTNPGPNNLTDEQFIIFKCWADTGFSEN